MIGFKSALFIVWCLLQICQSVSSDDDVENRCHRIRVKLDAFVEELKEKHRQQTVVVSILIVLWVIFWFIILRSFDFYERFYVWLYDDVEPESLAVGKDRISNVQPPSKQLDLTLSLEEQNPSPSVIECDSNAVTICIERCDEKTI